MYVRPEESHLIDGDLIRGTTFTATAPELRERLRALRDAGFTEVTFQITEGQDRSIEDWAELAASV
jgi:2-iminoacetate synthase ThiH